MAYIFPDSTIYLYNNIELDNSYKDTLYFSDINQQNQYFTVTKPYKYAFLMQMYQRTNKGTLRIEKNAEALYDCNYLRFKNPRTINNTIYDKWYYAFITDWEYINENVTEITYEIDIMQTYFFDVIVEPSFVVRQHEATDAMYGNIIEESLNVGTDYVVADDTKEFHLTLDSLVCFSAKGAQGTVSGDPRPTIINNVPVNIAVTPFKPSTGESLQSVLIRFLNWAKVQPSTFYSSVAETIISTYLLPSVMCDIIPDAAYKPMNYPDGSVNSYIGDPYPLTLYHIGYAPSSFGSYTPHNKKLYSHPYSLFLVSNHFGDRVEYKYELFANPNDVNFYVAGALMPTPTYMAIPSNYRGVSLDYDASVLITDFPSIPITIDGFQQWIMHNTGKLTASAITAGFGLLAGGASFAMTPIMGSVAGKASASALGGLAEGFKPSVMGQLSLMRGEQQLIHDLSGFGGNVASIIGSYADANKLPNGVKGNSLGNGILQSLDKYEFIAYKLQIREEQARKIDTFFDMFGYAQNRVTDVNRNVRPIYTYTKTEGCCIIPNQQGNSTNGANAQVIADMQKIYDNGITFWKASANVPIGDYSESVRVANMVQ